MTYYPDLSPYTYLLDSVPDGVEILSVGWLGADEPLPAGDLPAGFVDALAELCADHTTALTRGFHACQLKHPATLEYPFSTNHDGRTLTLGHGEVRVVAVDGSWLAAPDLVLHYVRDHGYQPPEAFIEAVLAGRVAPGS